MRRPVEKTQGGEQESRAKRFGFAIGSAISRARTSLRDKNSRPSVREKREKRESRGTIFQRAHRFLFNRRDESSYFEPHTIGFWRNLLVYLFLFSMVGHAMEIPYTSIMDALFGIVEEDYAANVDPWYLPYWVYGIGAVALTLIMVPMKIRILKHRKTLWGACLQFFAYAVILCAILETVMGLIINQPDEFGVYPFWDNSVLPLNILEQGWIVNDLFLGLVSVLYVWVLFPLCQKAFKLMGEKWANIVFVIACIFCAFCCIMSYAVPPIMALLQ